MTEKPLETIGDVNAALKHLGWETVDDLHNWAISNDIERFEQLVQAFATHRTEAVAALEADNAAHVRNTLDGYKVADELAAERDALQARVRELEAVLQPFASKADARRNNLNGAVCFPQSFLIAARKALHDPR